jgi:enoyl-CoA hydratase/carnithine racemase
MSDGVRIRKDAPSGTIIMDRPAVLNALSLRQIADLQQAFEDFHGERKVRGVILTNQGRAFCSGTDLKELHEVQSQSDALAHHQEYVEALQNLLETMLRFPKPIVASVSGWCVGTGLALMLACDYVLASPDSKFWLPEPQRGLAPTLTLPLVVFRQSNAVANRVLAATAPVAADSAFAWGLINELVAAELLWAQSHQLIQQWSGGAPHSLMLAKQLLNETMGEDLFVQLSIGASQMATARTTENAREGTLAFIENRPAQFV